MFEPIGMKWKGREAIGCWANYVSLSFDLTHDLNFGFSGSNFETVISQEWEGWLIWNKRLYESIECCTHYVTLNFDLICNLDLGFSGWFFLNAGSHMSGMGGLIDMEWKEWVSRKLDTLCDLKIWPTPWIFKVKVKFWKQLYLRNPLKYYFGAWRNFLSFMLHEAVVGAPCVTLET